MDFHPTVNEERGIGGSRNFGSQTFAPSVTNVTGTHTKSGTIQRMGKLLFWAMEFTGTSTTASSVFTPPISPQRINAAATYEANNIVHGGMLFDENSVKVMNSDGTYTLDDATKTDGVRRFSGWYWIT